MGAPKGHKMWGNPSKPKKFEKPEDLWNAAVEYFDWCIANPWIKKEPIKSGEMVGTFMNVETPRPFTIKGLCVFHGITSSAYYVYRTNENYKTYFETCKMIDEIVYTQKFEGAAVGSFNPNFIGKDLGLVEKQEIEKTEVKLSGEELDERIKALRKKLK
jgi:hypothetical protein